MLSAGWTLCAWGANSDALAKPQVESDRLKPGQAVYAEHCAACHGLTGDGQGPAAVWLFPKPRDFSAGLFKIQSTPAGSMPADEDLFQTITRGMPGSPMPGFNYLSESERRGAAAYVKHLTATVLADGTRINHFERARAGGEELKPLPVPQEPPLTFVSLTRGRELFVTLQCATCHGENGAGDGPSAATLTDNWGWPLPPRDFNTGAFRGGHSGRDLYLRIAAGMAGTPMPPFGDDVMTPEDRWALVHFIQSLRRKDIEVSEMLAPENGLIAVRRHPTKLPADPADPAWERIEAVRVPLNPLWPEPEPIPAVAVRAVHDGQRLAVLLQWRDSAADGAPVRVQDFQDAAAIQFSLNGTTPFLGMGDASNPVNLWQWKAGWQQETQGPRPDVDAAYASAHVDVYPETGVLFRTAEAAGNLQARLSRSSPIEDANARGFGTLTSQPAEGQNVQGSGVWMDGHWSVVFSRDLRTAEGADAQFAIGQTVPLAFAIWDGQYKDRNGRKEISNWFQLVIEP